MGDVEAIISAINIGNVSRAKDKINYCSVKNLKTFGGVDLAPPLYYAAKSGRQFMFCV